LRAGSRGQWPGCGGEWRAALRRATARRYLAKRGSLDVWLEAQRGEVDEPLRRAHRRIRLIELQVDVELPSPVVVPEVEDLVEDVEQRAVGQDDDLVADRLVVPARGVDDPRLRPAGGGEGCEYR